MKSFSFLLLFIGLNNQTFSQSSDILNVTKNNGKYLKSYFEGSSISFRTKKGNYVSGIIDKIKRDSVFVTIYVMGRFMTDYGFTVIDTAKIFTNVFAYNEVSHIKLDKKKFALVKPLGALSILGGAGYIALNLINKATNKEKIDTKENKKSLGIALSAIGFGVLLNKIFPDVKYTRVKINYINLQTTQSTTN